MWIRNIRKSLGLKLVLIICLNFFVSIAIWAFLNSALDVVFSIGAMEQKVVASEKKLIGYALLVFLCTSALILAFVRRFVTVPLRKLAEGTRRISDGDYSAEVILDQKDEIGRLAAAINRMGAEIGRKQAELNQQRDEYQNMFDLVPCIITVQNRELRLVGYNREFSEKFDPSPGDFCFHAYKGRNERCPVCPVEKTFGDGRSHQSEESGINKDGTLTHWIVRTSPIKNAAGDIVAAMEMSLDITRRRRLEEDLVRSENKYHAIFNNIPNPLFVLDRDTFEILDCNENVVRVYGFEKEELFRKSFLDLFKPEERDAFAGKLRASSVINQVKNLDKGGNTFFVDIRVSPSEYPGQKALLVTTSDITKRLEAEQQLIHAGKMATLGEMATGVAHELNQPLSVIKTAGSFLVKKIRNNEKIPDGILHTMASEIDAHVDRATRIIAHMREFGRKPDMTLEPVQVNAVAKKAFDFFGQQLKLRGIEVISRLDPDLPMILADPGRLEQVFINLLINARDAIEERWGNGRGEGVEKRIILRTAAGEDFVRIEVSDTGSGIPEPILEKIFEPFFTTKKVGTGTGLGLSISYGIVQECGGTIRAYSEEGGGARFVMQFPVQGDA